MCSSIFCFGLSECDCLRAVTSGYQCTTLLEMQCSILTGEVLTDFVSRSTVAAFVSFKCLQRGSRGIAVSKSEYSKFVGN